MLPMLSSVCSASSALADKKPLLEIGERRAPAQPVIGGKDRAAGDPGEKVEPVEQRHRAAARRHPRFVEAGQHAIGERRRAHAAAGERHRHDHVVVIGLGREFGFGLRRIGGERLIDRIVVDGRTADHQGGARNHTPRAERTLEPSPEHCQKLIGGPSRPVKEGQAEAKSKTSLRLIKKPAAEGSRAARLRSLSGPKRGSQGRGARCTKRQASSFLSDSIT